MAPATNLANYPKEADAAAEHFRVLPEYPREQRGWLTVDVYGPQAARFLDVTLTCDVLSLADRQYQPAWVLNPDGSPLARAVVHRVYENVYHLHVDRNVEEVASWLRSLSDGFVQFDPQFGFFH